MNEVKDASVGLTRQGMPASFDAIQSSGDTSRNGDDIGYLHAKTTQSTASDQCSRLGKYDDSHPSRFLTIASMARMPFSIFVRADTFAE